VPEIKTESLYIYDPLSAEILKPVDLLRDVELLEDDDLAALITDGDALLEDLGAVVKQLKAKMQHRLEADQAVLRETPGFTVKLTAQRTYEYDMPRLLGLKQHLTGERYAKTFKETVTPNKTELNKLVKLGGSIKAIIETSVVPVDKPPKLEIIKKAQVEAHA
jgi:hypothetical protein